MMDLTTIPANNMAFKDFLFKDKKNRTILWLAAIAIVVQFSIFKYLYPYASFIHGDSFAYLRAAEDNLYINTYLIGYSKFLRLFSVFLKSDIALTAFQYLFIETSVLYLLFTIFYFYQPSKLVQFILLLFMVLNPLFLHLANLVSSDGFFLALSMIWFTQLLWIIHKPSNTVLITHAIILFCCFMVRYNAMIYPFISVAAFWLSKISTKSKLISMVTPASLCVLFILFTSYQYKKLTGYWQYSPFSGWQLANNAMYAYRYVDSTDREDVPNKFHAIDNMIREYFDTTRDTNKFVVEKVQASTFYMWSRGLPLRKYRNELFKKDTSAPELKTWASMGPFYKAYGLHIICTYPWHFIKYFIWPNAKKYYAPPVEFLSSYNSGKDSVAPIAKEWFDYESRKLNTRLDSNKVKVLDFYPILSGIINIIMFSSLICYISLKGWQHGKLFNNGILVAGFTWLMNAGFTIVASSVALRFQSFPILLTTTFSLLLVDWMSKLMKQLQSVRSLEIVNSDGEKITNPITHEVIV